MSPAPEGWKPVPLDERGRQAARTAAMVLKLNDVLHEWEKPTRIVSSDLVRAMQTAEIIKKVAGLDGAITPMAELRAYHHQDGDSHETPEAFEKRMKGALQKILSGPGVALVVGHRSTSAYLDKVYNHKSEPDWSPDYARFALLHEGGILGIGRSGVVPLFRCYDDRFPKP